MSENLYVTFESTGSHATPSWDVYVSTQLTRPPTPTTEEPNHISFDAVLAQLGNVGSEDPAAADLQSLEEQSLPFDHDVVRLAQVCDVPANTPAIIRPLVPDDVFDLDLRTRDVILTACAAGQNAASGGPLLIESIELIRDQSVFVPSENLDEVLRQLNRYASAVVRELLDGLLRSVTLEPTHPNQWPTDPIARWRVVDEYGVETPIESLGSGTQRWARLAISAALAAQAGEHTLLILDEPERALHPYAQRTLATRFAALGDFGFDIDIMSVDAMILASHSPHFLGPELHRLHVHRDALGHAVAEQLDPLTFRGIAEELGVTEGDLLQLVRTLLLVEGPHDEIVFTEIFANEFAQRHTLVLRMFGAKMVLRAIELRLLFETTSIRVRVVVDSIGRDAGDLWRLAAKHEMDDPHTAERYLDQLEGIPRGEPKWLAEAGRTILGRGWFGRIEVIGLERPDVLDYLPVYDLVPGASSWRALRAEYKRRAQTSQRLDFKTWLKRYRGARINPSSIRRGASHIDDLADLSIVDGL